MNTNLLFHHLIKWGVGHFACFELVKMNWNEFLCCYHLNNKKAAAPPPVCCQCGGDDPQHTCGVCGGQVHGKLRGCSQETPATETCVEGHICSNCFEEKTSGKQTSYAGLDEVKELTDSPIVLGSCATHSRWRGRYVWYENLTCAFRLAFSQELGRAAMLELVRLVAKSEVEARKSIDGGLLL